MLIFRCVSVRESRCFSMAAAVTWAAFGRLAFAMGVSWVMFACITGYGGIINSFLSWPLFSPLSKLTYCTYLIHIDVIFLFFYSTKRPMYFSEYTIVSIVFLIITYSQVPIKRVGPNKRVGWIFIKYFCLSLCLFLSSCFLGAK